MSRLLLETDVSECDIGVAEAVRGCLCNAALRTALLYNRLVRFFQRAGEYQCRTRSKL
jgi:hypothetical protein